MAKYIGDVVHTEKYELNGEEKKKYTKVGGLFHDEEKGYYSVKMFGTFLNVFAPKPKGTAPKPSQDQFKPF